MGAPALRPAPPCREPFSLLKDCVRIALRRDKTRRSWMGFAHLATIMINLRIAVVSHGA